MACVLLDTFRGTLNQALSSHSPPIGAPWFISAGRSPVLNGGLLPNASPWLYNGGLWVNGTGADYNTPLCGTAAALSGADVDVSCTIVTALTTPAGDAGIVARWNGTTTWYGVIQDQDGGAVNLIKCLAGVQTVLESGSMPGWDYGSFNPLRLRVVGTSLRWWIGNEEQTPHTDGAIAAAGRAGITLLHNGAQPTDERAVAQQFSASQL